MKPELRDALNIEIAKANQEMRDFLNGQYFKDTLSLIERVNKFDADQAVSLELEVTMFLLGISDYASMEEAIRGELGTGGQVANEGTVRQAVKDVEGYILSKAPKLETTPDSVKKVEIKTEPTDTNQNSPKIEEGNLHDILYKELDINTKAKEEGVVVPQEETVDTPTETEPVVAAELAPAAPSLDFYREKIGDEDKTLKTV